MGGPHSWLSKIPQGTGFLYDLHLWFSQVRPQGQQCHLLGTWGLVWNLTLGPTPTLGA